MVSNIERVQQGLQKYKALGDGPESLEERRKTMRNIMIGLTNFDNIPPCLKCDPKECILARKFSLFDSGAAVLLTKKSLLDHFTNVFVARRGLRVCNLPLS